MKNLKNIFNLLTVSERKQAFMLLTMILVMAFLDVLGVSSILPFVALVADPGLLETNIYLAEAYKIGQRFGINSPQQFLILLGVLMFGVVVSSLAFKMLTIFVQLRFMLKREYSIGKRLMEGYLSQPYAWLISKNSSDIGKTVLSEVNYVVHNSLVPMMELIAQGLVVIAMFTLLVVVDPVLAFCILFIFGLSYGVILLTTRKFLARIGEQRVTANKERFAAVNEAFGAFKEVKMGSLEDVCVTKFSFPAKSYAEHQASELSIRWMPRYVIEAIAFGGIISILLALLKNNGDLATALPVLALYSYAGYRMLPALQKIYGALTQIRFSGPALDALQLEIQSLEYNPKKKCGDYPFHFTKSISLSEIEYEYPNTDTAALKGISLEILPNSKIGIVGTTGGGKTTLVDVILGLLQPKQGSLSVDGIKINAENCRSWQRLIGYVPQNIYLNDDTIASNIAFGVPHQDIDLKAVKIAAEIASLDEFVMKELPNGYRTIVGERGVRLSGGQRQRIGIARAIYNKPKVLILDEATSALDNITEESVMDSINKIDHDITVIMIAHRLTTIQNCDLIYLLENGRIADKGTFSQLMHTNKTFSAMVLGDKSENKA
jgi:ABC-type multidrug transport system fused ATPase/permease subunit